MTRAASMLAALVAQPLVVRLAGDPDLRTELSAVGGYRSQQVQFEDWDIAVSPAGLATARAAVVFQFSGTAARVLGWRLEDGAGVVWHQQSLDESFAAMRAGDSFRVHVELQHTP
jgi:hypothetical protein